MLNMYLKWALKLLFGRADTSSRLHNNILQHLLTKTANRGSPRTHTMGCNS